ncbi:TPA: hypothetical protein HA273_05995 [Candidatus Bathyarchaeota archaeon]|nr:hypothetical protein [Candidatus Bathyarchaeota archaeon]HIJ08971.1 hypothetical protein [Candidatus Bathyarchaeota archaeon]
MVSDKIIFNHKRFWPPDALRERQIRLYYEIKTGRKNCEHSDDKPY